MPFEIPIFEAEREAGLESLIKAKSSLACLGRIAQSEPFTVLAKSIAERLRAVAGTNDLVLHYLKTILVSTGWNKNDDVFDVVETWAARNSPEDTPFNYEHKCSDIIGHITGNSVIDVENNVVADGTTVDNLPAKFHILTSAVLYKTWDKPELQERMDKIIAEISEGKWYVSMECLFHGFDYAVANLDGTTEVVNRNKTTAFLTKHLRAYGGTGEFDGRKVGRLLRNIVFSGKGLVANPANPESDIVESSSATFLPTISKTFFVENKNAVYMTASEQLKTENVKIVSNTNMAIEVEVVQKQLDAALARVKDLESQLRDNDVKQVQAKLTEATAEVEGLKKSVAELTEQNKAAVASLTETKAALATKETELKTLSDEIGAIKASAKQTARLEKLKSAFKIDSANTEAVKSAETLNDSLASLDDASFENYLASQAKLTPAPLPPKQTPAAERPKQTNLPAPMAGKGSEDGGEAAADTAALNEAQPVVEPALSVATEETGVEKIRLSIASMFGYKADENKE